MTECKIDYNFNKKEQAGVAWIITPSVRLVLMALPSPPEERPAELVGEDHPVSNRIISSYDDSFSVFSYACA